MKISNFTLVEIMTVLSIILILSASAFLVQPIISKMNNDSKTRAIITAVDLAMENYKSNGYNGGNYPASVYPWEADGDVHYTQFFMDGYDPKGESDEDDDLKNINNNMIQFFDMKFITPLRGFDAAAGRFFIKDAYQRPLVYYCTGKQGIKSARFDLVSAGENGKPGTGGDDTTKSGQGNGKDGWNEVVFSGTGSTGKKKTARTSVFVSKTQNEGEAGKYLGMGDDIANFNSNR